MDYLNKKTVVFSKITAVFFINFFTERRIYCINIKKHFIVKIDTKYL